MKNTSRSVQSHRRDPTEKFFTDSMDHVKATLSQAKQTIEQARETVHQAKMTVESLKETARQVVLQMRRNPEPFIAAAIPGLIGIFLLVQRARRPELQS